MQRFRWPILVGELILLAVALAVPRMDLPQTAFDEANTPINQATVIAVLGCRSDLTSLRSAATAAQAVVRPRQIHPAPADASNHRHDLRSEPLLALLCTFLC
jgi:hypothetical protein